MDIPFELRFLAIFFTVVLLGQAAILLAWVTTKGVLRVVAAVRRRSRGARSPAAADRRVSPIP